MKTHDQTSPVIRSTNNEERVFSIKGTAKSFAILSSGLYSDKIMAIVRELSCNAADSHTAAGCSDTPVEIKLPTTLDPTFYVKDYGTGLSHDDVLNIYTTYFESTKTDSNDFIGALGLGSKSPFSYVNNFIVESRFNGTKTVYSAFKNEDGLPSIMVLGDDQTEEPSGMTISLTVKRDDTDKFYSAAQRALMYFTPAPNVIGREYFSAHRLQHTIDGSNWKLRVTDYYARMSGPYVIQGFVAYPIDTEVLKEHGLSEKTTALCSIDMDLFVPIGQVDTAASREALSYDKQTITNLIAQLEEASLTMRDVFQNQFNECGSEWESVCLFNSLSSKYSRQFVQLFERMHKESPFTYNGNPVSGSISIAPTKGLCVYSVALSTSKKKLTASKAIAFDSNHNHSVKYHITESTKVFVMNKKTGLAGQLKQYMVVNNTDRAIIIAPSSAKSYDQTCVDDMILAMGSPEHLNVCDFPKVQTTRVDSTPIDKTQMRKWGGTRKNVKNVVINQWVRQSVDLSLGGFFVAMSGHDSCRPGLDRVMKYAKSLDLFQGEVEVLGFNEIEQKKAFKQSSNWVEFNGYVARLLKQKFANGVSQESMIPPMVKDHIGYDHWVLFFADNCDITVIDEHSDIRKFVEKVRQYENDAHDLDTIKNLASLVNADVATSTITTTTQLARSLGDEWKQMFNTIEYPLISQLNMYTVRSNPTLLYEYINLVDSSRKTDDTI